MKILILLLLTSCFQNNSSRKKIETDGLWVVNLMLQDQSLKFVIEMNGDRGKLYNSDEVIELTKNDDRLGYRIGANYSSLVFAKSMVASSSSGVTTEDLMGLIPSGHWVRENKEDYRVMFYKKKTTDRDLFKSYETLTTPINISGKWKIKLSEEKNGLGLFTQKGARVKGSILTTTGDYRYLDGYLENGKLHLQGFDGVFAFVFKLNIKGDQFAGTMFAGKDYNTVVSGVREEEFVLEDPNTMTHIKPHKAVALNLKDLEGKTIDLTKAPYAGRPKIIQLFGSWCPNCLDESRFIKKWQQENANLASKIDFIALAFENFPDRRKAIKALKKSKAKIGMNYPLVLVDFDKSTKPEDILPIDKGRAFPTTLYLDANNKVIKVHTGFAGQATGPFFESFVKDFTATVSGLVTASESNL